MTLYLHTFETHNYYTIVNIVNYQFSLHTVNINLVYIGDQIN